MSSHGQAVREHLRSALLRLSGPGSRAGQGGEAPVGAAGHAIDAYETIGLLTTEEAAGWRGRLAHAAEDPFDRPPPDPEIRASAERWLQRELDADPIDRPRIQAGLETLAEVGALSPAAADAWQRRLDEIAMAQQQPAADASWWQAAQAFADLAPIAILPGSDRPVGAITVTAVELLETGIVVHTLERMEQTPLRDPKGRGARALRGNVQLSDGAGTAYRQVGGGASSGAPGSARIGELAFVPQPPRGVRCLTIAHGGDAITVPLR